MEYETKKLTDAWEEKWVSDEELAGIETSLGEIRKTWEDCRELLAEEGRTLYHEISQDRIDLLMQQMQEVSDYAQGMADHFFYYQDEPFYKAFVNGATEYLSRINLAEYKTHDIMTYEYVEGGLEINSDPGLGFSDFLGEWAVAEVESGMSGVDVAGITAAGAHMMLGHEQTAAVLLRGSDADHGMVRFAMYFEEQYRALEEAGVFEESDIVELTDYLDALAVQGEFEHSMDKPMLEFLNGMLDMLILPPLIEAMTGEELLTGEDLSGGQRIMKAVGAAMDIASIGQASLANGILKTGGRQALGILGKAATVEIGSNLAAYGTVSLGEALDLPVAVTIALGIGVGGGTHVKLSKVMFSDVDSAAVRAFSMTDADEEVTALRYTDEAAEAGRGVSRVSGSARLNTYGDALREKLGPAYLSHTEEYNIILNEAREMGVQVEYRVGTLAYDMEYGRPGKLIIDPDASIGALRHEYRHMLDDFYLGHPGMRIIADSDEFWRLEFRGYLEELNLARQIRAYDAGRFIINEMRQRRMEILGR